MGKITELQKLIENTTFDLDIIDMYNCQDLLLKFSTAKCENGLFLEVKIEQEIDLYMTVDLCCGDKFQPVVEKFPLTSVDSVIRFLTRIINDTYTVSNEIGSGISKLETHIMLAPSVDWVGVFKNELVNIFKDFEVDRTNDLTIHLIGIDFIVKFNDDTHAFSVEVVQTSHPDNSKTLLVGVVCDNNYNEVLSNIRNTFEYVKSRFCDLEMFSNMIVWRR